jgi:hypothetical protein
MIDYSEVLARIEAKLFGLESKFNELMDNERVENGIEPTLGAEELPMTPEEMPIGAPGAEMGVEPEVGEFSMEPAPIAPVDNDESGYEDDEGYEDVDAPACGLNDADEDPTDEFSDEAPVDGELGGEEAPVEDELGGEEAPVEDELGGEEAPVEDELGGEEAPVEDEDDSYDTMDGEGGEGEIEGGEGEPEEGETPEHEEGESDEFEAGEEEEEKEEDSEEGESEEVPEEGESEEVPAAPEEDEEVEEDYDY